MVRWILNYWNGISIIQKANYHSTAMNFSVHKDYKEGKITVTIEVVGERSKIKYRIESNIAYSNKLINIKGN